MCDDDSNDKVDKRLNVSVKGVTATSASTATLTETTTTTASSA